MLRNISASRVLRHITLSCLCLLLDLALAKNLTRQQIVESLLDGRNYDRNIPPEYELDTPTKVHVQIYIHTIDTVNENTMDYSLSIFLRQKWTDSRLRYDEIYQDFEPLEIDTRRIKEIWVPDLYFVNEKKGEFHDITVPNKLLHLYKNGTIFYSIRLSLVLSCKMNLSKYPMDSQICPIIMESYSYSVDNVELHWYFEEPVTHLDLEMAQFNLVRTSTDTCSRNYGEGKFSCIRADIHLVRDIAYFVIHVYLPTSLVVILSWVSFWLNVDSVPARISLGALTVLTLTTQSSGLKATIKKGSYIKAIDVWLAICMAFVFSALLEFALVNVLTRRKIRYDFRSLSARSRNSQTTDKKTDVENQISEPPSRTSRGTVRRKGWGHSKAQLLDKVCRIIFPAIFLTINLIYWIFYAG